MSDYRKSDKIGSGGFADVWRATRVSDNRPFALKELRVGADSDAVKRFSRETRILSTLDHPNIVKVSDFQLQSEPYWYTMPLYSKSLRKELASVLNDSQRIRTIFSAILDAVEYAHGEGVIHRDLKPENVLFNDDSDLVVSDFGLGRELDAESTRQTQTGYGMGSFWYMPPEQMADAKRADVRSDIFSLGRMLYEMYSGPLTGPFQDASTLPPEIAFLVTRCTQQDPARRFQTVTELKSAWNNLLDAAHSEAEKSSLLFLRSDLASETGVTQTKAAKLAHLLIKYIGDTDLIHTTVMQLHPSAVVEMYNVEPVITAQVISTFVEHAKSQGWGFSYTDTIASVCRALYYAVTDYEIRASLIDCLLEVGESHNRWYVLGVFAELLQSPKHPAEIIALRDKLTAVEPYKLSRVASYVRASKLPPELQGFFIAS